MQSTITFKSFRKTLNKAFMTLSLLLLVAGVLKAQPYVNGPLSTGATSAGGVTAPAGFTWSQLQSTNTGLGSAATISGGFTIADDFTIPLGITWNTTKATFYAYSTNYSGTTSPFNDVRIRIYNADPAVGNPTPVFGDLTTNRFASSSTASMYRVGSTGTDLARQIWKIEANVVASLPAGHYWIEWQVGGPASHFTPHTTYLGLAGQPTSNAKQRTISAGTFSSIMDGTTPQDVPFEIAYTAVGQPCANTAPGNTIASVTDICPNTIFNLKVQTPAGGLGISYQWQRSADGTTFTDITGATNLELNTSLTASTWYRLKVTCAANDALFSTPVKVNALTTGCYCAAGATSTNPLYEKISNVTFGTLNNPSTSAVGYEDFTGLTPVPKFEIGGTYPMSVTLSGGYDFDAVNVWIDLNGDGDFDDAGELVLESDLGPGPFSQAVQIPGGVVGKTRMRVRVMDFFEVVFGNDTDGPCGINTYGQVEDYTIELTPCVPIAFPATGSTPSIECGASTSITAGATGTAPVYQWQYRTSATGTWLPVTNGGIYTGATTGTLALTNVSQSYNGYQFRPLASGFCSGIIFGPTSTLTVTTIVPIVTPAAASICAGSIQKLTLTNTLANTNVIDEGFDAGVPSNWVINNRSTPVGTTNWFQGSVDVFESFDGAEDAYMGANFNAVAGSNTISNWIMTPSMSIKNGDIFSFYTRTTDNPATWADRLQVRLSTAGTSTDVGSTNASVGDFTTLLTEVNPGLTATGYPGEWTKITVTISGVTGIATGRIAFRYFVTNGGPSGTSSNFIGIDRVVYTSIGGPAKGVWTSTHPATIYTDAAATTAYVAGTELTEVYVKPDSTRTYKVSFKTPTPCTSGETSVVVTVGHPITGTITAASKAVCVGGNVSFTSSNPTSGGVVNHQWKYSTNGGATWANVPNAAPYAGATTNTLSITGVTQSMNQYQYRDSLYVTSCNSNVLSSVATLTVNALSTLVVAAAPTSTVYPSVTTSVVVAVNPAPAAGTTYAWTYNGTPIAGANTNTVSNIGIDQLGTYAVTVTDGNGCVSKAQTVVGDEANSTLFIYPNPTTNGIFHVRLYDVPGAFGYQGKRFLAVYDSKGAKVFTKSYAPSGNYTDMVVDLSNHAKGIYTVDVLDNTGGRLRTGRVVVQ